MCMQLRMPRSRKNPVVYVNDWKGDKTDQPNRIEPSVKALDKIPGRNDKGSLDIRYFLFSWMMEQNCGHQTTVF